MCFYANADDCVLLVVDAEDNKPIGGAEVGNLERNPDDNLEIADGSNLSFVDNSGNGSKGCTTSYSDGKVCIGRDITKQTMDEMNWTVNIYYMGYEPQTGIVLEPGVLKTVEMKRADNELDDVIIKSVTCENLIEKLPDSAKNKYPHATKLSGSMAKGCKIEECEPGWRVFGNKCEKEDTIDITISLGSIPIKDDDKTVKKDNKDDFLNAINKIDGWISEQESGRSKWKDAAGNFNGARLASDLTAGVVLGTVGGVVSGVVIKKKQVEKGFDSLGCYVGGQKMADWKDEFKVVFQRY